MIRRLLPALITFYTLTGNLQAKDFPKVILRGDYSDPSIMREWIDCCMTHSPLVYSPDFFKDIKIKTNI